MAGAKDIDALYDLPPNAFTRARDRLAARLRETGHRDLAAAIARLRKTSATVWAVNRVARQDPTLVTGLLDAFESVRRAQRWRRADDIQHAHAAVRAATEAAVERALTYMKNARLPATAGARRRLDTTLRGAAAYERHALRDGVLTHELVAPGADIFTDVRLRALPLPPSKAKRAVIQSAA